MTTIADRFVSIIESNIAKATRFKTLEEMSGIPAVSWRKAFMKGQRPTIEMIEFLATKWPEFAFWLTTGITDATHGHVSPATESVSDDYIPLSDAKLKDRYFAKKHLRTAAKDCFLVQIKIATLPNWGDVNDESDRLKLQNKFLALLNELDVLEEIRVQQERTLSKLEAEAADKMTMENGFNDFARQKAQTRIQSLRDQESDNYSAPNPPDIAF